MFFGNRLLFAGSVPAFSSPPCCARPPIAARPNNRPSFLPSDGFRATDGRLLTFDCQLPTRSLPLSQVPLQPPQNEHLQKEGEGWVIIVAFGTLNQMSDLPAPPECNTGIPRGLLRESCYA